MKTTFRWHALERIAERLHLSEEQIATILEKGLFCPLGKDVGSDKVHKLFFSTADLYWFVAVQDEKTGEVVTVLPIDYHNRWKISYDALMTARNFFIKSTATQESKPKTINGCSVHRFTVIFIDRDQKYRTVNLCSIPIGEKTDIAKLEMDPDVQLMVQTRIQEKAREDEGVYAVWVKLGNGGMPIDFNLKR